MGRLGRETCTVHLISAPDQPERKQMYHYIRKAKSFRGAIGGKTSKTAVLPWFCKIGHGGGSSDAPPCYGGLSLPGHARRAGCAPELTVLIHILCGQTTFAQEKIYCAAINGFHQKALRLRSGGGCTILCRIFLHLSIFNFLQFCMLFATR